MALGIKLRLWNKSLIKFTAGIRYITLVLVAKKSRKKMLPKGKIGHLKFWGEISTFERNGSQLVKKSIDLST